MLALIWVGVGTAVAGLHSRGELAAARREPVPKRPALVVESHDSGAGPPEQGERPPRMAGEFWGT